MPHPETVNGPFSGRAKPSRILRDQTRGIDGIAEFTGQRPWLRRRQASGAILGRRRRNPGVFPDDGLPCAVLSSRREFEPGSSPSANSFLKVSLAPTRALRRARKRAPSGDGSLPAHRSRSDHIVLCGPIFSVAVYQNGGSTGPVGERVRGFPESSATQFSNLSPLTERGKSRPVLKEKRTRLSEPVRIARDPLQPYDADPRLPKSGLPVKYHATR
jgi:hypothetical protein